jgi:MFS family permease
MFGMDSGLYLKLSAMMFLEFAVWGAWYPVLATRLLGPLGFSGKQTGWIYAALPLACIFMPMAAGQVADRWVNTEFILAGAHLAGTLLLFIAAWKRKFSSLFGTVLLYAFFYAATLPLVNSLMFHHLKLNDASDKSPYIFMWAPIAWALAGYFLTGWRWVFKTGEEGRDCLILAAVLSVVMAVVCGALLPATPPAATAGASALGMLKDASFLIFILISMVAPGMMQFYFLGTAQFMQDNGISAKNVPAAMAIAQATQAIATLFVLGWIVQNAGYKWTLTLGALSWVILFAIYIIPRPTAVIVGGQAFHGIAYVFFIIAGQMYAGAVAPEGAGASMQAMIFTAQSGIALFLGTQLAGVVMDKCRIEGRFQWRKVWTVPAAIMAVCVLALLILFKGTV